MSNTVKNQVGATNDGTTYPHNFIFNVLGCLIAYDKRLFETLHSQYQKNFNALSTTTFMDNIEERSEMVEMLEILQEMAQATKTLSDKKLNQEYQQILTLLGFKKESEVQNA